MTPINKCQAFDKNQKILNSQNYEGTKLQPKWSAMFKNRHP